MPPTVRCAGIQRFCSPRPYVTALLVPDPEPVTAFAARHGLDGGPAEPCRHAAVRAAIETGPA
ncbi:hypothetical protein [Streptomyces sp. NPDC001980]|uniref:hypothetical protein n=1 Tax=Streptomyces sp. NPDC001980 TaxID=3157126 RepID=UPI00331B718A